MKVYIAVHTDNDLSTSILGVRLTPEAAGRLVHKCFRETVGEGEEGDFGYEFTTAAGFHEGDTIASDDVVIEFRDPDSPEYCDVQEHDVPE